MGGTVKSAGVINLNNTFFAGRGSGLNYQIVQHNIYFPILYFTLPGYNTNGRAATITALAVERSIDSTAEWFRENPNSSLQSVGEFWKQRMIKEMNSLSGMVSSVPTFSINNPAPYITDMFTTGNCN